MVCIGLEPGAAEWKAQMNPLSYGGMPFVASYSFYKNYCSLFLVGDSFHTQTLNDCKFLSYTR